MRLLPVLALVVVLAAPAARAAETDDDARVLATWSEALTFHLDRIGYRTVSVSETRQGRRLELSEFLKTRLSDTRPRYFKVLSLDVDREGRPRGLQCRVQDGRRRWEVTGRAEAGAFLVTRSLGPAGEEKREARLPLEADVTFRAWTPLQAYFDGLRPGRTWRWRVIDESIGGLVPEPCYVRALGTQRIGPGRAGSALGWALAAERVAYVFGPRGRVLRRVWQSTPMIASTVPPGEATRLDAGPDFSGRGVEVEGLSGDRYTSDRFGYTVRIPPYPFVPHVSPDAGAIAITDLTDLAEVTIRPAIDPRLARSGGGLADCDEAGLEAIAEMVQQQWAARYDEVEAPDATLAVEVGGHPARAVAGTVVQGAARFHFRNAVVAAEGCGVLVTARLADRPLAARRALVGTIADSLKFVPPAGRLPVEVDGDRVRVPYYGLELRLPSDAWAIPEHLDGPATVLELARKDQAAVAVVRVLAPTAGDALADFARDRAEQVGLSIEASAPKVRDGTLAGRRAALVEWEGNLLGGRPARARALYTELGDRVLGLILVARAGDAGAVRDLDAILKSVKITHEATE